MVDFLCWRCSLSDAQYAWQDNNSFSFSLNVGVIHFYAFDKRDATIYLNQFLQPQFFSLLHDSNKKTFILLKNYNCLASWIINFIMISISVNKYKKINTWQRCIFARWNIKQNIYFPFWKKMNILGNARLSVSKDFHVKKSQCNWWCFWAIQFNFSSLGGTFPFDKYTYLCTLYTYHHKHINKDQTKKLIIDWMCNSLAWKDSTNFSSVHFLRVSHAQLSN